MTDQELLPVASTKGEMARVAGDVDAVDGVALAVVLSTADVAQHPSHFQASSGSCTSEKFPSYQAISTETLRSTRLSESR